MTRRRGWASFTLVEMLVGMAVFSLLMLILFAMMSSATKLWRDQSSREDGFREARAAMNILSRDISGALVSPNVNWFYLSTNRLAFLTTLPDAAQVSGADHGDICAVGYSLEWNTIPPGDAAEKNGMALYRYVRFSDPTYTTIVSGTDPIETVFDNPDGTNTVRELLARNVAQITFAPSSRIGRLASRRERR